MHRPHLAGVAFAVLAACGGGKSSSSPTGRHTGAPTDDTESSTTSVTTDPTDPTTRTTDSSTTPTDTATGLPPGLHGQAPAVAKGLPAFSRVTNRQGVRMAPADLVGHPTVLWFYPAAGTGG